MANNTWDNSGGMPNLSRLPLEIRAGLSQSIPIRPDECHAAVMIFQQSKGLNHPNGRCNVACYVKQDNAVVNMEKGLQLDFSEFSGRLPLATAVIDTAYAPAFIAGLLRAYCTLGGDMREVIDLAQAARTPEERLVFFEDRDNE